MVTRTIPTPSRLQGVWFPLSLAVLLLLALPGALLLALSLAGRQATVNGWLQSNFNLTYNIPIPWWAALLLFLLPFLIVLLYFLKLRRKPIEVPSTFLWRKSIDDLHVNSLFQWLRDNVLLLVQVLIVLLLIYAVLAFRVHGSTTSGKHFILIIDNSASMSATDVSPNRLEVARQEALHEIDAHGEGDSGMVIEFNSRANILQDYTPDKSLLRAAVRRIQPTQRPSRIDEALALAEGLANPLRSTDDAASRPENEDPSKARTYAQPESVAADVHLFSDGRFPDVPGFTAGTLSLNYHRIGAPGPAAVDNVGIVDFNATRGEKDPSQLQVFVRVLNYRPRAAEVTVELEARVAEGKGKGPDALAKTLTIRPRLYRPADPETNEPEKDEPGEGAFTFYLDNVDDATEMVLHARLSKWRDQFPLDDQAWLVCGVVRKARVLIVTPGNLLLNRFFDQPAVGKVAEVTYLGPADLKDQAKYGRPTREGAFDLVIFDRCAPAKEADLPFSNTFFIADVPPPWRKQDMKKLEKARILNPTHAHPIMKELSGLDQIKFLDAFDFTPPTSKEPPPLAERERYRPLPLRTAKLLECGGEKAVLFAVPRDSFTDLVLTFPLINAKEEWTTNWPLRVHFPLFLRNVLYELGNTTDAPTEENVQPGQPRVLRPGGGVKRMEVTGPGNVREVLSSRGREFLFKQTDQVGTYRASWGDGAGGQRNFAINLLDAEESNLQPRDDVLLGSQRIVAGQVRRQAHDTWKWVALAALGLLLLEWAVYHRRIFF